MILQTNSIQEASEGIKSFNDFQDEREKNMSLQGLNGFKYKV